MNPPERFELSNQERFDPLWVKLTGYFNDRIEELRKANDSIDLALGIGGFPVLS